MYTTVVVGVELIFYKLNNVANVWFNKWEKIHGEDAEPAVWDKFEEALLDHFFPTELREKKVEEFVNLKQKGLTVKTYNFSFIQLARYLLKMVSDVTSKMRTFVSRLGKYLKKESKATF